MSEEKIVNLLKENKFYEAKSLIFNLLKTEKKNLKYNFYYGLIFANEKKFGEAIKYFSILYDKMINEQKDIQFIQKPDCKYKQ